VRHALECAVFHPALAPLNDVYGQVAPLADMHLANDVPADPPSHRWRELMVDLFGRNAVGTRRSPVGPRGGRPNDVTLAHLAFAESYPMTSQDRRIVHHLLTAAGAFVVNETTVLSQVVDRLIGSRPEDADEDPITRSLLQAGQVGIRLARSAAASTWHLLLWTDVPYPLGPAPRTADPRASVDRPTSVIPVDAPVSPPSPRRRRKVVVAVVTAVCLIVFSGVYIAQEASGPADPPQATAPHGGDLEKPHLKIAIMPTTDLGPFNLAVKNGYFADAGFTFDPDEDVTIVDSGQDSVDLLEEGKVDIAYATYTPLFLARSAGAHIELVAGASSAGVGSCMVVALPDSKVQQIEDMPGARVAVTARNTMSDLLIKAALREKGIDHRSIEWVEAPFPEMAGMLDRGEIDAAFMIEPFLSEAEDDIGAIPVFDTATGSRLDLPTAGFAASTEFVQRNPKTTKAFQRIMAEATDEAPGRPAEIQLALRPLLRIDMDTVRSTTVLTFQSSLDVKGLQKVTNLMHSFGLMPNRIDVPSMIARVPG